MLSYPVDFLLITIFLIVGAAVLDHFDWVKTFILTIILAGICGIITVGMIFGAGDNTLGNEDIYNDLIIEYRVINALTQADDPTLTFYTNAKIRKYNTKVEMIQKNLESQGMRDFIDPNLPWLELPLIKTV
jgi:hypothetical protein